ncbi:MAG: sugar porter family MFS transporter [Bacteroidales bacterium]|nr:sugar porter family MFS transporter [Bacteroidales bacterium]
MKNNSVFYSFLVALIVALGGFLMGFDASVISGVNEFVGPEFGLSKLQLGWMVSCLTLTSTLAMLVSGRLSDKYGRKVILRYAAILYFFSAVYSALAPGFTHLYIARMIGGFGVGASLIIAPMYIAEIAPPHRRGKMVSFNQLNIVLGISVAFFTNYLIVKLGGSGSDFAQSLGIEKYNWRWMLGLESLPAAFYFFALFAVPESPRWLIMNGREGEALGIMTRMSSEQEAKDELKQVKASIAGQSKNERIQISELFKPALRLVLTIGIVVAVLQQITGINAVFFYAPMIFKQTGIGTDASFVQAIILGLTNLVFTVLAILFVDRFGRKKLLLFGVSGIVISMFLMSYSFNSAVYKLETGAAQELKVSAETEELGLLSLIEGKEYQNDIEFKDALNSTLGDKLADKYQGDIIAKAITINPWLVLIGILGFVASFAVSLGPVMWILFSELFPNRIRGLAIGFAGFVNSAISYLVQQLFPWELANLGNSTTFLIFGIFGFLGLIYIIFKLPETKGKSLEELEKFLIK